ncbi:hypothetical protein I316_04966 [Kwoniella heveanensis BCC8398]|uniref:Uncharacterized protein n=1 Tax=Kwoniella heveanensis BCC8398 TaxID=1296120 RepID=A0A1B9GQT9_9TREE|nr:hypothetical protein I316_04966 [Kwoniella heveanensis BCC8398]
MLFTNLVLLALAGLASASSFPSPEVAGTPTSARPLQRTPKALKQVTTAELIKRSRRSPTIARRAAPSPIPAPDTVTSENGLNTVYTQYYSGSGIIETDNNPGNDNDSYPPKQLNIPGTTAQNAAIQQCASFSDDNVLNDLYFSFQIYYDDSVDNWICRAYYDPSSDASYFNVPNTDANPVFGYSGNFTRAVTTSYQYLLTSAKLPSTWRKLRKPRSRDL